MYNKCSSCAIINIVQQQTCHILLHSCCFSGGQYSPQRSTSHISVKTEIVFPQAVCPFFVSSLCNDIFSSACREGQSCLCILLNTIPQKAQLHDPPLNALVPTLIFLICFIRPNVTFVFILSPNTFSKLKCPHLKKEICIYLSGSCRSLAPEKQ